MRRELREGLSFVFRQPYLRILVLATGGANFFWNIGLGVLIVYLVRTLDLSPPQANRCPHVVRTGVSEPASTTTQPSNSLNRHGAFMGTAAVPSVSTRKLPQNAASSPSFVSHS